MMKKHALKITALTILFVLVLIYGWNLFQRINYNRLVFESDVYAYVPSEAKAIINFSRKHHFDEYSKIDTTNIDFINYIKDDITFPFVIVKFNDEKDDLLLLKATKEQEENLKEIFNTKVAPYHAPTIKKVNGVELFFHSLSNNEFLISSFNNGVCAISKDYTNIENFAKQQQTTHLFNVDNPQIQHYAKRVKENSPISIFAHLDTTVFILSYELQQDTIVTLDGEYYGKLERDSLKLSYNEMNKLLELEDYYTDSIDWSGYNKIKIWINKLVE